MGTVFPQGVLVAEARQPEQLGGSAIETGGDVQIGLRVGRSVAEDKSYLRGRGKLFLAIKPLINCIARTGLLFAGSTGIFATACFSKFAVAAFDNLFDFMRYHFLPFGGC